MQRQDIKQIIPDQRNSVIRALTFDFRRFDSVVRNSKKLLYFAARCRDCTLVFQMRHHAIYRQDVQLERNAQILEEKASRTRALITCSSSTVNQRIGWVTNHWIWIKTAHVTGSDETSLTETFNTSLGGWVKKTKASSTAQCLTLSGKSSVVISGFRVDLARAADRCDAASSFACSVPSESGARFFVEPECGFHRGSPSCAASRPTLIPRRSIGDHRQVRRFRPGTKLRNNGAHLQFKEVNRKVWLLLALTAGVSFSIWRRFIAHYQCVSPRKEITMKILSLLGKKRT